RPLGQETPSFSSEALNFDSVLTPTSRSTSLPPLKISTVGIAEMRSPPGVSWFSSVFNLPILTLPPTSLATFSIVGATIRHGPHHGAQKSIITGTAESRTSDFQLASVNSITLPAMAGASSVEIKRESGLITRSVIGPGPRRVWEAL